MRTLSLFPQLSVFRLDFVPSFGKKAQGGIIWAMTETEASQNSSRIRISDMFALSFGAALIFLAVFWSFRHAGDCTRFSLVALIFAIPQLAFPYTWRLLRSPRAVIFLGAAIAASCAVGSFFPLATAKIHIYGAPWFVVLVWYFNIGCLASAILSVKRGMKGAVVSALHLSFILISLGMAVDGIFAVEGVFRATPKMAPGQMPPAMGYLAPGETVHTLIEHSSDPGFRLPFSITLKSFEVEFYPSSELSLSPSQKNGVLNGVSFELAGFGLSGQKEPVDPLPMSKIDDAVLLISLDTKREKGLLEVPMKGERYFGGFVAEVFFDSASQKPELTEYEVKITAKGLPKRYTSIVDVLEHDSDLRPDQIIEVNRPLRVLGWSVYQANWGEFVTLDEWENLPGAVRTSRGFRDHLKINQIPPCSFFTVVRMPGKPIVYAGYLLMFIALMAFVAMRPSVEARP